MLSDHNRTSVSRSHSQVPVCASCSARSSAARSGRPREASRLSVTGSAPALRRARRWERCRVLGFGGMGSTAINGRKRGLLEYALTQPRSAPHVRHLVVAPITRDDLGLPSFTCTAPGTAHSSARRLSHKPRRPKFLVEIEQTPTGGPSQISPAKPSKALRIPHSTPSRTPRQRDCAGRTTPVVCATASAGSSTRAGACDARSLLSRRVARSFFRPNPARVRIADGGRRWPGRHWDEHGEGCGRTGRGPCRWRRRDASCDGGPRSRT